MEIRGGFLTIFATPSVLLYIALGVIVGVLVGAMPGMSAAATVALLVPLTLYMDPLAALAFLYVLGKAGRFGGSIAAILFNTPGTVAASATMIDGYPLTRQGRSKAALRMSSLASMCGDYIGDMFLIFGAVYIASYTERFGPPEYFAIYFMAFVVIGSVVGDSVAKGLISAAFGILCALIGTDPISGAGRLTFGSLELERGLGLIPLLVGLFVLSELFDQARLSLAAKTFDTGAENDPPAAAEQGISRKEWGYTGPVILRSSLIGAIIGMLPGLGSAVACFAAYGEEKRRAKRPDLWGKGAIEGVAAPEAANNAVSGPSMIPLLTLGVPGSTIAALLMGVFLLHGIQIGPTIFTTSRELIFALFASGLIGIAGYGLIGYYLGPIVGYYITRLQPKYIYPFIFVTVFVAAYSSASNFFDVYVMTVFGIVGYLMRRFKYSTSAFVIAFVLGRGAEETLRQSMLLSDRELLIFVDRPVALAFFVIGLGVLVWRSVSEYRRKTSLRDDGRQVVVE
jgi:putative tricarboxylic transport membrane protein